MSSKRARRRLRTRRHDAAARRQRNRDIFYVSSKNFSGLFRVKRRVFSWLPSETQTNVRAGRSVETAQGLPTRAHLHRRYVGAWRTSGRDHETRSPWMPSSLRAAPPHAPGACGLQPVFIYVNNSRKGKKRASTYQERCFDPLFARVSVPAPRTRGHQEICAVFSARSFHLLWHVGAAVLEAKDRRRVVDLTW